MVQAVLDDYRTAPISDAERVLFEYLDQIIENSSRIQFADVERVRQSGWSDEAIYDAIMVCALFHYFNKWIDATGVSDLPAAAYEQSGQRMAQLGYTRDPSH